MKSLLVALAFLFPHFAFAENVISEIEVLPTILAAVAGQQTIKDTYIHKIAVFTTPIGRLSSHPTSVKFEVQIFASNGVSVHEECLTKAIAIASLTGNVLAPPAVQILGITRICPDASSPISDADSFSLKSMESILRQQSVQTALKDSFRLLILPGSMPIRSKTDSWENPAKRWAYNLRIESLISNEQTFLSCSRQSIHAETVLQETGAVDSTIREISEPQIGNGALCPGQL